MIFFALGHVLALLAGLIIIGLLQLVFYNRKSRGVGKTVGTNLNLKTYQTWQKYGPCALSVT